ncbi:MAG: DUF2934 domain-containing protein [Rhodoferax sp.]|nr:DUF2934 domain-containing protein [Rhodoferax sp.]
MASIFQNSVTAQCNGRSIQLKYRYLQVFRDVQPVRKLKPSTLRKYAMATTTKKATPVAKTVAKSTVKPAPIKAATALASAKTATVKQIAAKPVAAKKAINKKSDAPTVMKASIAPRPAMSIEQRNHCVSVAAFYIAERRGFTPGNPQADWLQAEAEIDRMIASGHFAV